MYIFRPNNLKRIVSLIIIFITFFSLTSVVLASDKSDWIAECERRNLINSCDCDCRKDYHASTNINVLIRCKEGEKNYRCPDVDNYVNPAIDKNRVECAWFSSTNGSKMMTTCPGISNGNNVSSNLGLVAFPNFQKGIIVVHSNGSLDVGHTAFNILYLVFIVGAIAAVAFVLYGMFVWGTAGPDDDRVTEGQNLIKNAVIGFLIMMAAMLIMTVLSGVLGFSDADQLDDIDDSIDNTNPTGEDDGETIRDLLNL